MFAVLFIRYYFQQITSATDLNFILQTTRMKNSISLTFFMFLFMSISLVQAQQKDEFIEIRGRVMDRLNSVPLSYCNVLVEGSHASTVTNADGEFIIKLSPENSESTITFRHIGFKSRQMKALDIVRTKGNVLLDQVTFQLPQIDVLTQDAETLVRNMFANVSKNYPAQDMLLTAFYRETIRKNKSYVSLSEAVVDVQKQSYQSHTNDAAKLFKARKQADYQKLDTLIFKLMGGPYNNLFLDIVKNPEIIFTEEIFRKYYFTFEKVDWMDDKLIYVVDFNHYPVSDEALYSGKLYIDASTMALRSAVFNLTLENKSEAMQMFIKKKPANAKITITDAAYRMDYVEKDGKWYYAYSRIELGMKINWKSKLFNTNYFSVVEMAVTDRETKTEQNSIRWRDRLKENVIISEAAQGFSDPDFWGPHNVIEPEKPIEAAIRKIQKQLEKK